MIPRIEINPETCTKCGSCVRVCAEGIFEKQDKASLPVATQILGCDSVEQVDRDAAAVRAAKPMTDADRKALLDRTKPHAGRKTERYKRRA